MSSFCSMNFLKNNTYQKLMVPAFLAGAILFCALSLFSGSLFAESGSKTETLSPALFEEGEDLPGGKATSKKSFRNKNAFSHSSGNLSFSKELDFKIGNGLFRKLWVSSPSSTKSSDGLGPLFNARSCQRCHLKDGRGHTPNANWPEDTQVSMFLRLSIPPRNDAERALIESGKALVIAEPNYGGQLQDLSIQGHDGEGHMSILYEPVKVTLKGGEVVMLRKPTYSITDLKYGPLHDKVMMSPRLTPQMIGLGLLEAIAAKDILSFEDWDDKDNDGISGRANMVWSPLLNEKVLGRFGWKAGMASLKEQTAAAFSGDIGISSTLHKGGFGDCTLKQKFCLNAPDGASPKSGVEISDELLDLVTFYASNLAVPKRRDPKSPDILKGKALFHSTGCAQCHRPKFVTDKNPLNPHLEGQTIWPYTDLMLHDMGAELADHRPEGGANGFEWRTPPLWGIGLTKTVNGHEFMMHDGRARSIEEAILWHGGEGAKAKEHYRLLSKAERNWLIAFVESL